MFPPNATKYQVEFPTDRALRDLIDLIAEYVSEYGVAFEQALTNRASAALAAGSGTGSGLGGVNPDDAQFAFLCHPSSLEHLYYRWKVYSLAQGDSTRRWRTRPFQMLENGPFVVPPDPAPEEKERDARRRARENLRDKKRLAMRAGTGTGDKSNGSSGSSNDRTASSHGGPHLSASDSAFLSQLLRAVTPEKEAIRDLMGWALDHAESSRDVVDTICESLTIEGTPVGKKIARSVLSLGARMAEVEGAGEASALAMRVSARKSSCAHCCTVLVLCSCALQSVRCQRHSVQLVRSDSQRLLLSQLVSSAVGVGVCIVASSVLRDERCCERNRLCTCAAGSHVSRCGARQVESAVAIVGQVGAVPRYIRRAAGTHVRKGRRRDDDDGATCSGAIDIGSILRSCADATIAAQPLFQRFLFAHTKSASLLFESSFSIASSISKEFSRCRRRRRELGSNSGSSCSSITITQSVHMYMCSLMSRDRDHLQLSAPLDVIPNLCVPLL